MQIKLTSLGLIAAVFMTAVNASTVDASHNDVSVTHVGENIGNHAYVGDAVNDLILAVAASKKRGLSVPAKVATAIRRRALARRSEEADEEEDDEDEEDEAEGDEEATAEEESTNEDDEESEATNADDEEEITEDSEEETSEDSEESSSEWERRSAVGGGLLEGLPLEGLLGGSGASSTGGESGGLLGGVV